MDASTIDDIAARMYPYMHVAPALPASAPPGPPSSPATPAPPAGSASPEASQGSAGSVEPAATVDPEMQALRDDPAERMFSRPAAERTVPENLFDELIGKSIEIDGQAVQVDDAIARTTLADLRQMAADLNVSSADVGAIDEGLKLAQSFKGDEQKTIAAREAAVDLLNAEHGDQATLAARAARAYVAKNPKLAQMLDRTGAGDAPQMIVMIARRAMTLHKAGKLTVAGASKPDSRPVGAPR